MIHFDRAGHIEVICGCMGSGKSEAIIHRIKRYEIADKGVICFKPSIDSRDGASILSRNNNSYNKNVNVVKNAKELQVIFNNAFTSGKKPTIGLVAIDEAQFFDEELVDVVHNIGEYADVVIAGLEKDYAGKPFGIMPQLLAIADEVQKLKAICVHCKKRYATYTYRKIHSNEQVIVGGDDIYEARCRQCWQQ
jgi:thymidine kinase